MCNIRLFSLPLLGICVYGHKIKHKNHFHVLSHTLFTQTFNYQNLLSYSIREFFKVGWLANAFFIIKICNHLTLVHYWYIRVFAHSGIFMKKRQVKVPNSRRSSFLTHDFMRTQILSETISKHEGLVSNNILMVRKQSWPRSHKFIDNDLNLFWSVISDRDSVIFHGFDHASNTQPPSSKKNLTRGTSNLRKYNIKNYFLFCYIANLFCNYSRKRYNGFLS